MFAFDSHFPAGLASRPIRPTLATLAPLYSAITITPAARASYNGPRIVTGLRPTANDGASAPLSPDQQRWFVLSTRPRIPRLYSCGVHAPRPRYPTTKNIFPQNSSTTYTSSLSSSWSNVAIVPSKSTPRPSDLSLRSSRARAFCRPYRLGYAVPPTDRGQCPPSCTLRSPSRSRPAQWRSNARLVTRTQ